MMDRRLENSSDLRFVFRWFDEGTFDKKPFIKELNREGKDGCVKKRNNLDKTAMESGTADNKRGNVCFHQRLNNRE